MASVPELRSGPAGDTDPESLSETVGQLRQVVVSHLKLDAGVLRRELTLGEDLCLDSLAAAELLVAIEEDMHIQLPPSILAGREGVTYGELEDLVREQVDTTG